MTSLNDATNYETSFPDSCLVKTVITLSRKLRQNQQVYPFCSTGSFITDPLLGEIFSVKIPCNLKENSHWCFNDYIWGWPRILQISAWGS